MADGVRNGKVNEITEGVIWKQLLIFFFPILFGIFFQQLYNTADAVIVGRFVGKEALAAVGGSTSILINLLVGFFVGLSSGATVIISQFYGGKKEEGVSLSVHTAIALSLAAGIVMMVVGLAGAHLALRAMGVPAEILGYASLYIRIYFIGMIPNLIYNMGSGILRALGDSKRPLYFLIASCLFNIVLDLLFVIVFKMGVAGVGIATVSSQILSAALVVRSLMKTEECYKLEWKKVRFHRAILQRIIQIGLPAGLQSMMYNVSNVIIQSSVNTFGTDTIAAWTAYGKIDAIFWTIINAFGVSITTFAGQNFGAGKIDRVHKGIRVCLGMSAFASVVLSVSLYFGGAYIFRMFTSDPIVVEIGMDILKFLVPFFITYICVEVLSGSLRATGDALIPMIITCLGVCVLRIAWIFFAVPVMPTIKMVVVSYPITWITTSILFIIYMSFFSKNLRIGRFGKKKELT